MFNPSSAVTVYEFDVPAVTGLVPVTEKWVAAPALTEIELEVPVMELVAVSVAVMVRGPVVLRVTENVPVPLVSVEFAGSTAAPSLEVKWTVPVYPVAVLLDASSAVTVMLKAVPAVAVPGAVTEKCVAGPAVFVSEKFLAIEPAVTTTL